MFEDGAVASYGRIMLMRGYTDLRCGIPSLSLALTQLYGADLSEPGVLYVFCGRRCDRVRALLTCGGGTMLVHLVLHAARLRWPRSGDGLVEVTQAQLDALLRGERLAPPCGR